jgi:hypothetical protein
LLVGQALELPHHHIAVPVKADMQALFLAARERNALVHNRNVAVGINGQGVSSRRVIWPRLVCAGFELVSGDRRDAKLLGSRASP